MNIHPNFRLLSLLLTALTIGCTMPVRPDPYLMKSSTQGSTLVRMATITAVGNAIIAADRQQASRGEVIASNPAAPQGEQSMRTRTVTELLLHFDDGASATYRIEPGEVFQSGERVKVMTRNGNTRITH